MSRPGPLVVSLAMADRAAVDLPALARRAAELAGTPAEPVGGGAALAIAFPAGAAVAREGPVPYTVWLIQPDGDAGPRATPDLSQTWGWPGAAEALAQARDDLLVTDMLGSMFERTERLRRYHAVLAATVEHLGPVGLHVQGAGRWLEPTTYLADRDDDPLAFASTINVRLFRVEDPAGETVMDTLGMEAIGLPDAQMHFTTLDPGWVAAMLGGLARYLFERGDVIEDGNTVHGLREGERWRCQHEVALAAPRREVLDVHPGAYAPARRR